MQCGIRAVKLPEMTVGVCLRSDTCVTDIGDVKTTGHCLIRARMIEEASGLKVE